MQKISEDKIFRRVTSCCSSIVFSLGMVLFISWHMGLSHLLQIPPSLTPMPYRSALCLFCTGPACFILFKAKKMYLAKILGAIILLLSMERILEVAVPHVMELESKNSPMTLLAACAFTLVGLEFLIWPKVRRPGIKKIFLILLASLILFIGAAGTFIRLFSHQHHSFMMHFYIAIGLFFAGFAFLFANFYGVHKSQEILFTRRYRSKNLSE